VSENGWIDDFLALKWFENTFIPEAKKHNKLKKIILLIYDGHGSHTAHAICKLALKHGIHLFCFPSHCTHKLQPLDVRVFGPLQRAYAAEVDAVISTGQTMTKYNVISTYMMARSQAFKPEMVWSAFAKTGIHPWCQSRGWYSASVRCPATGSDVSPLK